MNKRGTKKRVKKNIGSSSSIRKMRNNRQSRSRIRRRMRGGNTEPEAPVETNLSTGSDSTGMSMEEPKDVEAEGITGGKINKKRYRGNGYKKTVRKIRFSKNRKYISRRCKKGKKTRSIMKGGSGAPFFLPDVFTNTKDSLMGGLTGIVNGYKGVETPYQVNHTFPYQQVPSGESYRQSVTDATSAYNRADNYVLSNL